MDFSTVAIMIFICTATIYMIFLVLGVSGVAKNRNAQGIEPNSDK